MARWSVGNGVGNTTATPSTAMGGSWQAPLGQSSLGSLVVPPGGTPDRRSPQERHEEQRPLSSVCDDGEAHQPQQQKLPLPPPKQQQVDDNNDDHPLSPRYYTYRSSLASRLVGLSSSSSSPPAPQTPANRTRVQPSADVDHLDWEPRIAAAMVSFDSSDDADDDDAVDVEQVRLKLVARLERNGTSRGWDDDEEAAAAGAEAAAALGVAERMAVRNTAGYRISSSAAPLEFTVHNRDGTDGDPTLRLDSPFDKKSGPTVAPTTPQSWYSTTSSLTDPMVTPVSAAPFYRDYNKDSQDASSSGLETAASVAGTPTRETAPTLPLSPPRKTAATDTTTTTTTAQLAADGTVLYGVRFPDQSVPPTSAAGSAAGPPRGRPQRGGCAVAPLAPPNPPSVERPPPSPSSSPPPPPPPPPLGQHPKQCVRALLGGGILLLLTAVALALAFVLTHRTATTASTGAAAAAPTSASPFTLVPGGPPAIAPTTTTTTFAPAGVDTGGNIQPIAVRPSFRPPAGAPTPNPWTRSPQAVRRPTRTPSRRPRDPPPTSQPITTTTTPVPPPSRPTAPTSQPSWWDPTYQEWVESLVGAYTAILQYSNADVAQLSELFFQDHPALPQRLALEWLLQWHTPSELDRLGAQRLLQRYALAVVYYGTREGLTSGGIQGDDDDSATQSSTGPTFGQFLSSNGDCGWRSSEGGFCALDAVEKFQRRSGILLDGTIPAELGFLSNLDSIDWSNNRLHGKIPTTLAVLTGLSTLNLRNNQLTGTVPSELAALRSATAIMLDGNDLEGTIPSDVCASFAGSNTPPTLYVDCGGNNPKVSCPPGICCTYCCYEGDCQCVYDGTPLEGDLC